MRGFRAGMLIPLAALLALTGCSTNTPPKRGAAPPAASSDRLDLRGACPQRIVVQTDWDPESEYGVYYSLLGPDYKVDRARKRVSGSLVAEGASTGVQLEVRAGGPSIGFEPVTSQMYLDPAITLGQVNTDESVRFSARQPTVAVVAPMEVSPFMIMWDPKVHPDFRSIADIGRAGTKVLYFQGDTYMEYLTGAGILHRSQVNGSYDGKPANYVAAGGRIAQAGFATSEPYIYEHELPQWGRPVRYALISDTGYPFYPQALAIRAADKQKLAPCLRKLVPIVQRAQIDYLRSPDRTSRLIVDLVRQYKTGWRYSAGLAAYAIGKMRTDFVTNGSDRTLGNFDPRRVQRIIDIVAPIFRAQGKPPRAGLRVQNIATNEFIDAGVGIAS